MKSGRYNDETEKMRILLFAGTTEGRKLAEVLNRLPIHVYVSTATEYGKECAGTGENIEVSAGRMDEGEIAAFITEHQIDLAVDATHPFATAVTENIKHACSSCQTEYIRCLREGEKIKKTEGTGIIIKNSIKEAVDYLKGTQGNIFISTGSKELKLYTEIENYKERCCARVLSTREAVEESTALGFKGTHLIAMQGPYSKEMNIAMLHYTNAKYFVTKESGKAGGFAEKAEAARDTGVTLVVIGRPEEEGAGMEEIVSYIEKKAEGNRKKKRV